MVKIRIPRSSQPSRSTLEAEINRLKQELETERSSTKQLRASLDVMQIGWDSDRQKLTEAAKLETSSQLKVQDMGTNTLEMRLQEIDTCTNSEGHNVKLQSKKASSASQDLEDSGKPLLTCSLCCKETFANLEQYRTHLNFVVGSLKCPFCVKTFCLCSLNKHLDKGCLGMHIGRAPYKFLPQSLWTKEAETQTSESSSLPMQDLVGMVSLKMVQTIDKNGTKRLLPHITMEPYSKAKIQFQKNVAPNEQNGDFQFEVPSVEKVPADSTGTHTSSPIHSNVYPPDNQIYKSTKSVSTPKNRSTEKMQSQEPQTKSKSSHSVENFEKKMSRASAKQSDSADKKQTEQSSETLKTKEKKKDVKPDGKPHSSVVSKSPNEKSVKMVDKSLVSKNQSSKPLEKSDSVLKSNKPVEKSASDFTKSKYEKEDKTVETSSFSGLPSSRAGKNEKAEGKQNSNLLQTPNTPQTKQSEQSHSTDLSKSGSEKKTNKTSSKPSSSQTNKNKELARSSSSEVLKTPDKKMSKHQSVSENVNCESVEKLAPAVKSKRDLPTPKPVKPALESQGKKNTPTSEKKKEAPQKGEIKERKADDVKDKESTSGSNNESARSSDKGGVQNGLDSKSSADKKDSGSGSIAGSSADASTSEGGRSDEFYCSACAVYFKSVVQHLEAYHAGEEVEIEDEAYQEVPDELRKKLVCKAETEVTEKVKEMLLSTCKKVGNSQSPKENGIKKKKRKKSSILVRKESLLRLKLHRERKSLENHLTMLATEAENRSKDEKKEIFKCKDCEEVFSKEESLQQHLCKSTMEKNTYACNQCNERFPLNKELSHRKMHMEERKTLRDQSKKSQTKETTPCQTKLQTEESDQTLTTSSHNMPHCEVLLKDIGGKHALVKRKQPETPSSEDEGSSKAKKPLLENSKEVGNLPKDNTKDVAGVEVPNSLEVDVKTPSADANKPVVEHTGKDNQEKSPSMRVDQNAVEVKTPSTDDEKSEGGTVKKWKNWREKIRETNPEYLEEGLLKSNKRAKKYAKRAPRIRKGLKILNEMKQKKAASVDKQIEATSAESDLKAAAERSVKPTGAKDYWKTQREELKNDPKKWETFLAEEQERFKERIKNEKKQTETTQAEGDGIEVKPEAPEMDESQIETPSKSSDNAYKCTLCPIEFTSLRQSEKHKLLHDKKDAYRCTYCPCVYQLRVLLDEHLSNEHGKMQD